LNTFHHLRPHCAADRWCLAALRPTEVTLRP
jgi:hypothetical protein